MDKDKKEFWEALRMPNFHRHDCDTCKYDSDKTNKTCSVVDSCGMLQPTDIKNPKNKWEWDGETMPPENV